MSGPFYNGALGVPWEEPEPPKPVQYAAMEGFSGKSVYLIVAIFDAPKMKTRGAKTRYEIINTVRDRAEALGVANTLNKMNGLPLWDAHYVDKPTRKNLARGKR